MQVLIIIEDIIIILPNLLQSLNSIQFVVPSCLQRDSHLSCKILNLIECKRRFGKSHYRAVHYHDNNKQLFLFL